MTENYFVMLVILLYVTIITEKTEDERVSSIKQLTNHTLKI
jgi:hypothetical protein